MWLLHKRFDVDFGLIIEIIDVRLRFERAPFFFDPISMYIYSTIK